MKGDVIYQKAFENLVDYCNFISKGSYADKYSPNNIKRLIVSPDCIEMHYHIALPNGGGRVKRLPISPQMLQAASNCEDYVPVMRILGTERVCGSIEEIIMLVPSNDRSVFLSSTELDFVSLVKSYSGRSGSIEESIKRRYKRLHDFVIAQVSYGEYTKFMQMHGNHGKDFLCELPIFANQNIKMLNNDEDWYRRWGSAGQTYEADKIGGCLHEYFTNFEKQRDAKLKKDAVDKHKEGINKEAQEKFDKAFQNYRKMYSAYRQVLQLTNDGVLTVERLNPYGWVSLMKCKGIPEKYPRVEESNSDGKALSENLKRIQEGMTELQKGLATGLANNLRGIMQKYPVTVAVSNHEGGSLVMPEVVLAVNSGLDFRASADGGKKPKEMFVNMCYMLVRLCGDRTFKNWDNKMLERRYWEGLL